MTNINNCTDRDCANVHVLYVLCRSTLLASLIAVEYEKPMDTFQDLLDNDMILPFGKGKEKNLRLQSQKRNFGEAVLVK